MPETCENWLGLVLSCIYYAHQSRKIYKVLPYSVDYKAVGGFGIYWIRQYWMTVALVRIKDL